MNTRHKQSGQQNRVETVTLGAFTLARHSGWIGGGQS